LHHTLTTSHLSLPTPAQPPTATQPPFFPFRFQPQEVYGNSVAGEMLSALSRLLTLYLQWHGFTCGMDDLLLVAGAEDARQAVGFLGCMLLVTAGGRWRRIWTDPILMKPEVVLLLVRKI
jgi:hypothetical protein